MYKKVFMSGVHHIPKDKSVIFALNHPTAFIEPALFSSLMNGKVRVLLRGDAFFSKTIDLLLRDIGTIPIYRFKDGFENMRRNEEIMTELETILYKGDDSVLILCEGNSAHEKRLRPIQKGTARLAFGTYEKHNFKDIAIVPVAINYADPTKLRSTVNIHIADPLLLIDYLTLYEENKRKAINQLTKDLSTILRGAVVHIENPDDDELVDKVLTMNRNDFVFDRFPNLENDSVLNWQEYHIVEKINAMDELSKTSLSKEVDSYMRILKEYRIDDFGVARSDKNNFMSWFCLIVLFPPHMIGLIWNYVPVKYVKWLADRKSTDIKFHSSLIFGFGQIIWPLAYLGWIVTVGLITNWIGSLIVAIMMPTLGYLTVHYLDLRNETASAFAYTILSEKEQSGMRKWREKILNKVR